MISEKYGEITEKIPLTEEGAADILAQFASPDSITASVKEACLDCSWLEEPLYLDATHFSRLEKILKSAKLTGVGNCGYGAKLTLTLENGEILTLFKGTDDCGSLVFGSWGGYSVSDEADSICKIKLLVKAA